MKVCNHCKEEKDYSDFNKNKNRPDGLQARCRECQRSYDKKYWEKVTNASKEGKLIGIKLRRIQARQYIYDYLKLNPCIDCGETNPIVLEFDHKDSIVKSFNISNATHRSIESIQNEIDKCDIRCANCHRLRTAKQFNWYKDLK